MTRIMAIQGSPRKGGNTHLMLDAVLEGAREVGAETALVHLTGLDIGECTGCSACWRGCDCPLADDMNALYPKLAESDVIVLGTPVYWYGPTALLKAFLDRLVYFNCPENRAKIRGKKVAAVIPYEETGPDTVAPLVKMFELSFDYLELVFAGNVIAPGIGKKGEIRNWPDILERCRALGRKLAIMEPERE